MFASDWRITIFRDQRFLMSSVNEISLVAALEGALIAIKIAWHCASSHPD